MGKQRERSHKYRIWQSEVFKRDNYTCQGYKHDYGCRCQDKDKLTAHHIKPWSKFPKDRFKLNNGETLCVDCHQRLEKERRADRIKKEKLEMNAVGQQVGRPPKLSPRMQERVRELYKEGYSTLELADMFMLCEFTTKRYCKGISKKAGKRTNELKKSLTLRRN